MFQHKELLDQPIFYLFIAFTILLTLGYFWGSRRNNKIFLYALNSLVDIINPKDQTFTRIGGMIGYHANIIPKNKSIINQVNATILLLPRHAWLYFPISLLFMQNDKFFINIEFKSNKFNLNEGHIINKNYHIFKGPKIENEQKLQKEDFLWGKKKYLIYYENTDSKNYLLNIIKQIKNPELVKHIAFVPEDNKIYLYLVPRYRKVFEYLNIIYNWISSIN